MSSVDSGESKQNTQDDSKSESGIQVHSANSWETADLGDKQRNEKFLRLMGASKKEHHGKIVIGDSVPAHKRNRAADSHTQEDLEEQFTAGMEHRLAGGKRGHLGLGFHPDTDTDAGSKARDGADNTDTDAGSKAKDGADNTDKPAADGDGGEGVEGKKEICGDDTNDTSSTKEDNTADTGSSKTDDEKLREKDERKRESSDKNEEHEAKKMKFVKSSS